MKLNNGNVRVRAYRECHEAFVAMWKEGFHLLEIAQRLHLSPAQLQKHGFEARMEPRTEPDYECLRVCMLPETMRTMLPFADDSALVKIETYGEGLIITLMPSSEATKASDTTLLPVTIDDESDAEA